MSAKENKVLTGFRLSKKNIEFIDKIGGSLGLNRTSVLDMFITIIRRNNDVLMGLIKNALNEKT